MLTFEVNEMYTRIHHVKLLAFHGDKLEYNGSQGANGAG